MAKSNEKMITVRVPSELRERVQRLARQQSMSMNTLCINLLTDYAEKSKPQNGHQGEPERQPQDTPAVSPAK